MISIKRELHRCKCEVLKTNYMTSFTTQTLTDNVGALIMIVNNPCVSENGTNTCAAPSSPAGLAVGLTFFLLLVVIVIGVIIYKYHSKIRNMLQFAQRRSSQEKEYYIETPQDDSHQCTSTIIEQSTGQTPIYENLTTHTGYNRPAVNKSRLPGEPEEDVYMQCDTPDDAIYSNDVAHDPSTPRDSQEEEEDVYIVPDA